ncbi:PTS transporter subunit IIABC [Mycoplasmopsis alligatoris]|uniref:PTS system, glucose-like IIB component n=1 Tax=Mycoplasmopsis alligatoris A21JP2 TaxID=747682 RepID=D4XW70_9BACT|nr:PTS transporter subunit IIABC [Mycoplasmopsis alligatoris]EFF41430.1 PTS system, glucose-like IIB component [Mycoplasmopsis alligatoris A21JP2]
MNTLSKKFSQRSEKQKAKDNSGSGKWRKILSKVSGAFMLPISIMAIAGLFLGVGATIASNAGDNEGLKVFGNFIKMLGEPVFAALPLLFAAAFVVAFTDEAGVGVFATIVAYLTFTALQSVFITESWKPLLDAAGNPLREQVYDANLGKFVEGANDAQTLEGYVVLFAQGGRDAASMKNLVGSTLGFKALQTSAFGGIVIGLIVQYLYNRFHTIQLPSFLSFFGGKRFVSIIAIVAMIPTAFIFLLLWPWIGKGLNAFGGYLGQVPYGFESFIFGFLERSLVPFGLHHAFYAPLWYSQAGGDLNSALKTFIDANPTLVQGQSFKDLVSEVSSNINSYTGDSLMSIKLVGFKHNEISYTLNGTEVVKPLFDFIAQDLGVKVGRFLDGKFSFMIFGLPAAGVAMILAAPKENRKIAIGAVVPAAVTCMVTGVTEPIEFTFLFLAPWLFWGFHAFMCAVSFMLANLLQVHIPMAFSGGLLDLVIYGIIPMVKGTNWYWTFAVGVVYAPIYFFVFYLCIKWFNLETPGRGENTRLFTKADYLKQKDSDKSQPTNLGKIDPKALAVVQAYGGLDNITAFNNCASRLRYDVKDGSLVDDNALKASGAAGVKHEGNKHVQAIFGPVSEQLNAKIKSQRPLIAQWEAENKKATPAKVEETKAPVSEPVVAKEEPKVVPAPVPAPAVVEAKKPEAPVTKPKVVANEEEGVTITAPACGRYKTLESLNDGVFSEKMVGEGFVVKFSAQKEARIYAPFDGHVTMVYDTKHAYGLTSKDGLQMLLHIGLDTVKLNGEGFTPWVKTGQRVRAGDILATIDMELLKSKRVVTDLVAVVLPESAKTNVKPLKLHKDVIRVATKVAKIY